MILKMMTLEIEEIDALNAKRDKYIDNDRELSDLGKASFKHGAAWMLYEVVKLLNDKENANSHIDLKGGEQ